MGVDRDRLLTIGQMSATRRRFLRFAVTGAGSIAFASLLAACGGDDDDDDEAEVTTTDGEGAPAVTQAGAAAEEPTATEAEADEDQATEDEGAAEDEAATEPDQPQGGQHLVVGWLGDFVSLDPSQMRSTLDTELGYKIYSSLARLETGSTEEVIGDLAESWEVSDDGLIYTFSLRQDAEWQHGYGPVTAEDVQWSFLRHKDEEVGSQFVAEASTIEGVEVVDEHSVEITMSEPYPGFIIEFAAYRPGFIVNQEAMEELGDSYPEQPVGSGPFVLEEWSPQAKVELVQFDGFYGDSGVFERVTYEIIPEESTLEIALERGEVDIGYFFTPEIQNRLLDHDEIEAESITGPRTWYLQMNQEREPFSDVRVRQAMWYAIDKDALVESVLQGQGTPTDTLLNPHVFGRLDERAYTYDPDKAKELLAEAGYPEGFEATFANYSGTLNSDIAVALQSMWADVGINVEIEMREWPQHVEARRNGNFDIALQPQLRLGPDQYMTPLMHSGSIPYPNASRYSNSGADELIEAARTEPDQEERRDLYHQVQRMLHEEVPVIPLFHPVFVLAYQPEIQGAVPGIVTLNITEMSKVSS